MSFNNPVLIGKDGERQMKQFRHQELTLNINGVKVKIHENGKVTITTSSPDPESKDGDVVIDEVTVSASLIFKIVTYLKDTRQEVMVPVSSVSKE